MSTLESFNSIAECKSKYTSGETIICIDNIVYDVTGFLNSHPGGKDILIDSAFTDATNNFNNIGHSDTAHKLMNKFKIGTIKSNTNTQNNIKITNNSKLFTHEDPYNFHKILGLTVLLSYMYNTMLFIYHRYFLGQLDYDIFGKNITTLFTIILHGLLSLSSLIFNVPRNRINDKPMIWKEFRAHNILFAMRSLLVLLLTYFAVDIIGEYYVNICRIIIVLGSMIIADVITDRLRENNHESTTRTMPYWDGCSDFRKFIHKKYYTFAQMAATLICTSGTSSAFFILVPIQLASLLMTLVRKGFLDCKDWHVYYLASLIYPVILYFNNSDMYMYVIPICTIMTIIRSNIYISKYVLWGPILLFLIFK